MGRHRVGTVVGYVLIVIFVAGFSVFLNDILFTKPDHLQGIVIEKIFIPAQSVSGTTPYGGVKRSKYFVTSQKEEQWIAVVKMENGEIVKVHCHPGHYKAKSVGNAIHFKKYEGKLLHIEYFAHNEEED